jgi:hypothetical protein
MKAGELRAEYIKVLSQTFTIEELKELNAFFRSPAGKAFVRKQPELALQFMETSQRSLRGLLPKAAAKARDAAGGEEKKKAERYATGVAAAARTKQCSGLAIKSVGMDNPLVASR